MGRNISIRSTEDYYPNQGSSRRRQMVTGDPVTYPNQGSSKWGSVIHGASGAWRAEDRRPNGRDLIDLTGNGRDLLMGGESSAYTDGRALVLPGLAGNYASVPDEAALDITGDIDLRADVALDDWTPAATVKIAGKRSGGQSGWVFRLNTSGTFNLFIDGGDSTDSTAAPTVSDGGRLQVRVTLDVDNGASGNDVTFYTRAAGTDLTVDTGWTQLGTTVTNSGTTSIASNSADLLLGTDGFSTQHVDGSIYAAVVKDGIDGTAVLDVNFDDATPGGDGTTFTATSGQTVTINGSTTTNDPRVLDYGGTRYMFLDGASGQYASVPDEAALDITGDIDITVDVALDDWTPASASILLSKLGGAPNASYDLYVTTSGGLVLRWSADGTNFIQKSSTSAVGAADGSRHTIRATLDVDNGASGYDVTFYVDGVQLGSTVTTAGSTSIYANTQPVGIGASPAGSSPVTGKIWSATVKDGINGTTVLDVDFTDQSASSAPYTMVTAQTGQTVTLNGRATLVTSPRLYLDGVDDFLSVADDPVFDVGASDDLTVVTVFEITDIGAATLMAKKPNTFTSSAGYMIPINGSAQTTPLIADNPNRAVATSSAFADSTILTIALTLDRTADELNSYMNGALGTAVSSASVGDLSNSNDLTFGTESDQDLPASAQFFGAAVFKGRVLTAAEIAQVGRELAYREASVS